MNLKKAEYILASLIILLFIITGLEKAIKFSEFKESLAGQVFDQNITSILLFLLPASEMCCAILLANSKSRLIGFLMAIVLLLSFTIYIFLIVKGTFPSYPCSCGGPFNHLTWAQHLIVNCAFLAIAILGLIVHIKERRAKRDI